MFTLLQVDRHKSFKVTLLIEIMFLVFITSLLKGTLVKQVWEEKIN